MAILDITGAIAGAATASSGLILVYIGASVASFQSYQPQERRSVKDRYQFRVNLAFGALLVSVFSAVFALVADWMDAAGLGVVAFVLLMFALLGVAVTAYLSLSEIS
ncbi:MAG: hypothetical protein ACU0CA_12985 [Paracoccaceae bacterium]